MKRYLLLLLLPILAYANIGKITVLKGKVTIQRDGKDVRAKAGSILQNKDFIKTSKNAKVQIVFKDKTIFTIGKNSTLDIADYLYDEAKPSNNRAKFNVLKGAFTSITGKIGKFNKSKFKLKTKSASIGIRGTIVKANQDTVMCTEGGITVTTPNGMSIDVDAGSKTSVASGSPSTPETITAEDEAQMGADVTEEDKKESEEQAAKEEKDGGETKATEEDDGEAGDEASDEQKSKSLDEAQADVDARSGIVSHTTGGINSGDTDKAKVANIEGNTLTFSDDSTKQATSMSTDSAITWGSWDSGNTGAEVDKEFFIYGTQSSNNAVNALETNAINSDTGKSVVRYDGSVQGNVKNKETGAMDTIKTGDGVNQVQLDFDLGGSQKGFTGEMNFDTAGGQEWRSTIGTGSVNGGSFSSSSVSGSGASGRAITSGNVDGSFYGDSASQVGGNFNMQTGNNANDGHEAVGVFKGSN